MPVYRPLEKLMRHKTRVNQSTWRVLTFLCFASDATGKINIRQWEIARKLSIEETHVSGCIKKLVQLNLVTRHQTVDEIDGGTIRGFQLNNELE